MRRSTLLLGAAAVGGAALGGRAAARRQLAEWDTNPDLTDGDPLGLPPGEIVEVEAADGAVLRGYRCGDAGGETVVMVHGLIESTGFWGPVARRLAESGHDVVLIDQRGHGRSERGESPYRPETLGNDLRHWFEGLDLDNAVLVGHSMGGLASMAFAIEHPEFSKQRTRSLVLVATLAHPPRSARGASRLPRTLAVADRFLARERMGLFGMRGAFGTRPTTVGLDATRRGFLGTDPSSRVDAIRMLLDFDLRPELPTIDIPTLVVAGSNDQLTPLAINETIVDLIPSAQIEVLPGIGHMIFFEDPTTLTSLIERSTRPEPVSADQG